MVTWNKDDPEIQNVSGFVEFLVAEDRETFTGEELQLLNQNTHKPVYALRAELEDWGLRLAKRPLERRVRGVRTSSNDRWFGPGSSSCHGGSGYEQIVGFAGRQG